MSKSAHQKSSPASRIPASLDSSRVLERAGWVPFACIIGALIIASVAGITWNTSPYYGRNDKVAKVAADAAVGKIPVLPGKYLVTIAPNRIDIPKLKASAPIVDVGTTSDGELAVPVNPRVAGWWSPGAKPGAATGTAIIAGHINYAGVTGTFANIGKLQPGDTVNVYGKQNASKAMVRFRVTGVRSYKKTVLPYKQIFDQKSVGRLALVTCGGAFDTSTGNYLENIVVFAVPMASKTV
ncbi:MAG: class F sortase [Actinomycetota bacterium]|nr:class F sortase [Actinomycetota bacterium]